LNRASLGVQTISGVAAAKDNTGTTYNYYTVTPPAKPSASGWVMDLVFSGGTPNIAAGTRVIYPELTVGTSVFVNALSPSGQPAECGNTSGTGYFFLLNAVTGSQASGPTWDTNGDGVFSAADQTGAGVGTSAGGTATYVYKTGTASDGAFFINSDQSHLGNPGSPTTTILDRVWRQILTPPTP
jgi:hypothetical protein